MKKITALKVQKRNPNRVNVHLDGEFGFGLARIVAAWLNVGDELSEEKIAQLQVEDGSEISYQRAIHFLSYRPRSEKEIADNLRKHDTPEDAIEQTLDRLKDNRLVDDRKFAEIWLENRSTFRPRGFFALQTELRQKGISDQIIEETLQDIDELPLAFKAGRGKSRKIRSGDAQDYKKKMYGFLSRRGFSYDTISEVIRELWSEKQSEGSPQD